METWALPFLPRFNRYVLIAHSDSGARRWGGALLYARKHRVKARPLTRPPKFEAGDAAVAQTPGGLIGVVYISPAFARRHQALRLFEWLSSQKGAAVYAGDFNARSPTWCSAWSPNGRSLVRFPSLRPMAPSEPTCYHSGAATTVDISTALHGATIHRVTTLTDPEWSDHRPILVEFEWGARRRPPSTNLRIPQRILLDPAVLAASEEHYCGVL